MRICCKLHGPVGITVPQRVYSHLGDRHLGDRCLGDRRLVDIFGDKTFG